MLSGLKACVMADLHLGHIMASGPEGEYNVEVDRPMKHTTPADLAADPFGAVPARRLLLLKSAWPAAVGADLARRSQVVALDGDLLRIRVPDAIWRKSLWRMRSDLLARLRRVAGAAAPHALGFAEGPVTAPPEETPPPAPTVVERPLPADLTEAADSIPDPEVRERFRRTAEGYLGRFSPPPSHSRDGEGEDGSD
jgi:hypothetical protein